MQMPEIPQEPKVDKPKPGWQTSEFVSVITVVVANVIAMLVLLGYVAPGDQQTLVQSVSALVGAAAAFISNGLVVWKYVQSRTEVKTSATNAQANLQMERFNAAFTQRQQD